MTRSPRFRIGARAALAALVPLVATAPLAAQQVAEASIAHDARFVATPISVGQTHVLAGNLFTAFLQAPAGRSEQAPLTRLAREAELEGHALVGIAVLDTATPDTHWAAGGADGSGNPVRAALATGDIDVLMLSLGARALDEGIDRFADLMIETNPDGRILVQDAWQSGAGSEVDRGRLERLRARLRAIDARAGHEMAYLVPSADAVDRLRWQVARGEVPGVVRQADLFADAQGRPSQAVANLVTYLWFTVMYRQPAEGLTALVDPADPTSPQRERILQRIAWEAAAVERASGLMEETLWLGRSQGPHAIHQRLAPEGAEDVHGGHSGHD